MERRALKTLLFDLDGTLLDTIELILYSYRHTLAKHIGEVPPEETFLKALGIPLHRMLSNFSDDPREVEAMVTTYRDHNLEHHDGMISAYEGAVDAVRAALARGATMAIVTSKSRSVCRRGLDVCGFEGLFDVIVAAEDVEQHKPHPEPVERALEHLGAKPEETVFVGDSPFDMEAGRRAGVKTAAALWGPFAREELVQHQPSYWLEHPSEIDAFG